MQIKICDQIYKLTDKKDISYNLLSLLFDIKRSTNRTLAFKSGCKSGVCGSCAVRVNGVEVLACKTTVKNDDRVEPLKNLTVIKDLIVDTKKTEQFLKQSEAQLHTKSENEVTIKDEKKIDIESNCVLCLSCFSSCPVYQVNENFLGPFALTRTSRYVNDIKEENINSKINRIQKNGIWDCTLCGNCNIVCPSQINIKGNIEQLRNKSAQLGYNNPNMNISFDNQNFGFNPNGF